MWKQRAVNNDCKRIDKTINNNIPNRLVVGVVGSVLGCVVGSVLGGVVVSVVGSVVVSVAVSVVVSVVASVWECFGQRLRAFGGCICDGFYPRSENQVYSFPFLIYTGQYYCRTFPKYIYGRKVCVNGMNWNYKHSAKGIVSCRNILLKGLANRS